MKTDLYKQKTQKINALYKPHVVQALIPIYADCLKERR